MTNIISDMNSGNQNILNIEQINEVLFTQLCEIIVLICILLIRSITIKEKYCISISILLVWFQLRRYIACQEKDYWLSVPANFTRNHIILSYVNVNRCRSLKLNTRFFIGFYVWNLIWKNEVFLFGLKVAIP